MRVAAEEMAGLPATTGVAALITDAAPLCATISFALIAAGSPLSDVPAIGSVSSVALAASAGPC